MNIRRVLLGSLLAVAAALPAVIAAPSPAEARVFVGFGFGFPYAPFGYGYPYPYYYPPPPVVYAPPPAYYPPPSYAAPISRCVAANLSCPLREARPLGSACGCPDAGGRYIPGRVG